MWREEWSSDHTRWRKRMENRVTKKKFITFGATDDFCRLDPKHGWLSTNRSCFFVLNGDTTWYSCHYLSLWSVESYTSKTCTCCGYINKTLGGNKRFVCDACGLNIGRDVNGAMNILKKCFYFWTEHHNQPDTGWEPNNFCNPRSGAACYSAPNVLIKKMLLWLQTCQSSFVHSCYSVGAFS